MLAMVRVKPALISIWLLANAPRQTTQDGAVPGPCAHGRDPEGARAFDLDQAGNCGHLVSEPAGTGLFPSSAFPINVLKTKNFTQKYQQLVIIIKVQMETSAFPLDFY